MFSLKMFRLTLWLRAGSDGVAPSGDPSGHFLFMLLITKRESDPRLQFDVKTVNESRPPAEFKEIGLRRAPALQVSEDCAFSHEDDILEELAKYGQAITSPEADDAISDLFRLFAFYIKDVQKDSKALVGELHRVDEFLSSLGTDHFIGGATPTDVDCVLLTRLHSIRIAAKALKDFEISPDFKSLWSYLGRGYQQPCFTSSSPSDQEIILHWADRPGSAPFPSSKRAQMMREKAVYTHTV